MQKQVTVKDDVVTSCNYICPDSKIIEDSLLALSKRAPQIESKINEEIN